MPNVSRSGDSTATDLPPTAGLDALKHRTVAEAHWYWLAAAHLAQVGVTVPGSWRSPVTREPLHVHSNRGQPETDLLDRKTQLGNQIRDLRATVVKEKPHELDSAQLDLINALTRERDQIDIEISRLDGEPIKPSSGRIGPMVDVPSSALCSTRRSVNATSACTGRRAGSATTSPAADTPADRVRARWRRPLRRSGSAHTRRTTRSHRLRAAS
jgi:hypothetical protein